VNANELRRRLTETFDKTTILENDGDTFFIYDPDGDLPPERQMPYVTILTGSDYEQVSNLSEPGSYRLNIGLTKATYTAMFGQPPTTRDERGVLPTGCDYTVRDELMPHPSYASQYWVCVSNPSDVEALDPLLMEAHEFAARKHANYQARHART
jgi:hypothetical protein